jgi:uncharacterized protein YecT (DUF1311 family)
VNPIRLAIPIALLLLQLIPPAHAPKITEEMIKQYLAEQSQCELKDIYLDKMEYFNFTGHEWNDVIVVASTCNTGTAGPDVQSVFSWGGEGKLIELAIEKVNPKRYQVLFGNRNYDLEANPEDRTLIERFRDTSDRDDPLVLIFQWDGKLDKFLLISVKQSPIFKTSYDCAKAQNEVDLAICYVQPLAQFDIELNAAYTALAKQLSPDARQALIHEQRDWLAKRDHDCVIYKWWVGCLTDMYTARISELKKRGAGAGH